MNQVVFDDRIMAIVVRLIDENRQWECVNRVAHITVGTRDGSVKPKESNDLLDKWLDVGASPESNIRELHFEDKRVLLGTVAGVMAR